MRKIGGLNRPSGRLEGHSPAGHGECYAERFPSTQALGCHQPLWHLTTQLFGFTVSLSQSTSIPSCFSARALAEGGTGNGYHRSLRVRCISNHSRREVHGGIRKI